MQADSAENQRCPSLAGGLWLRGIWLGGMPARPVLGHLAPPVPPYPRCRSLQPLWRIARTSPIHSATQPALLVAEREPVLLLPGCGSLRLDFAAAAVPPHNRL